MPKKHILVVEDSPDIQSLVSQLLTTNNFSITQAYDGQQALFFAQTMNPPPSLILLDLKMPVMGGLEFLKERLNDPKLAAMPVIVMTSDTQSKSKTALLCANEFIQKPLQYTEDLIKIIHRITDEI